jgi:hypothetical protein
MDRRKMTYLWKEPKDEEEWESQIAHLLEASGWIVERQKVPEECKTWPMPYRVDIFAYKTNEYAIPFIIECKMMSTFGQGSVIAEACDQLDKYEKGSYLFKDGTVVKGQNCNRIIAVYSNYYRRQGDIENSDYYCPFEIFMSTFLMAYTNSYLMIWTPYGIRMTRGGLNVFSICRRWFNGQSGQWVYMSKLKELPMRGEELIEFEINP